MALLKPDSALSRTTSSPHLQSGPSRAVLCHLLRCKDKNEVFGYPDNLKFRSCMTLFLTAATDNTIFKDALLKYFDGKPDQLTLDILAYHRP